MATDLSSRYNEDIVPKPDISIEVPRLRSPANRPTPKQLEDARSRLVPAIIILILLLLLISAPFIIIAGVLLINWLGLL